jgi:protein-S-isoprenylcysteine O-methyltransferase Ste14
MFSNIDLNTIIYFAAIIVAVVVIFGILSFAFKHLIHWFARGCGCIVFIVLAFFVLHVVLKIL